MIVVREIRMPERVIMGGAAWKVDTQKAGDLQSFSKCVVGIEKQEG